MPREEVPSYDRSYRSGVFGQFCSPPKAALPQSSHLCCVAKVLHSSLLGVAIPEEVLPKPVLPRWRWLQISTGPGPPPSSLLSLEANALFDKAPEELGVKWWEAPNDEKLARSIVVTSSQTYLFIDVINAAATVPENAMLDDVKLCLVFIGLHRGCGVGCAKLNLVLPGGKLCPE